GLDAGSGEGERSSGTRELIPPPSSREALGAAITVPVSTVSAGGREAPEAPTIPKPTTAWPPIVVMPPAGAPPISPVMHLELPPELRPHRHLNWLFWTVVLAVVAIGGYYFFREAPAFRPLWDKLEGTTPGQPTATTETTPAPVPTETAEPP